MNRLLGQAATCTTIKAGPTAPECQMQNAGQRVSCGACNNMHGLEAGLRAPEHRSQADDVMYLTVQQSGRFESSSGNLSKVDFFCSGCNRHNLQPGLPLSIP